MIVSIVRLSSWINGIAFGPDRTAPQRTDHGLLSSRNSNSVVLLSRRELFLWYLFDRDFDDANLVAGLARHAVKHESVILRPNAEVGKTPQVLYDAPAKIDRQCRYKIGRRR